MRNLKSIGGLALAAILSPFLVAGYLVGLIAETAKAGYFWGNRTMDVLFGHTTPGQR